MKNRVVRGAGVFRLTAVCACVCERVCVCAVEGEQRSTIVWNHAETTGLRLESKHNTHNTRGSLEHHY